MIGVHFLDGIGKAFRARVSSHNALYTCSIAPDIPDVGEENRYRFYAVSLGSSGADAGTTNQNVDGSVVPQEFYISSDMRYDIHVMGICIIIADTGVAHNNFGNVSALAIGWDLIFVESGDVTYLIQKAKTGGQVIAKSGLGRPYGDGVTSFELLNWTGTTDAQTIFIPVGEYIPGGLRIGRGTNDSLVSIVNDNLTGLTEFSVQIFGYRHYP